MVIYFAAHISISNFLDSVANAILASLVLAGQSYRVFPLRGGFPHLARSLSLGRVRGSRGDALQCQCGRHAIAHAHTYAHANTYARANPYAYTHAHTFHLGRP